MHMPRHSLDEGLGKKCPWQRGQPDQQREGNDLRGNDAGKPEHRNLHDPDAHVGLQGPREVAADYQRNNRATVPAGYEPRLAASSTKPSVPASVTKSPDVFVG